MSKKITELDFIENIDDSALFLTRPNGSTDDKKITARSLLDSIGNPNVKGFNASVVEPGVLQLIPVNDGFNIGGYIEGMTISFISPITTTDEIYLKLEGLGNRKLSILNSIELCVIKENEYIEAVYVGDNTTGEFKRTNLVENTIITNEYNTTHTIDQDGVTYNLTSAIGTLKTQYYKGMSVLFTPSINSTGVINIKVDGLEKKILADPVGDGIPFKLYKDQAVMAIYNGSYFIKHIFSILEPDNLYSTLTINVGPNEIYTNITTAIEQCLRQLGEKGGGRNVILNLKEGFIWDAALYLQDKDLSWLTIINSSATPVQIVMPNINNIFFISIIRSAINIKGRFHIDLDRLTQNNHTFIGISKGASLCMTGCTFTFTNITNKKDNFTIIASVDVADNSTLHNYMSEVHFNNVNINIPTLTYDTIPKPLINLSGVNATFIGCTFSNVNISASGGHYYNAYVNFKNSSLNWNSPISGLTLNYYIITILNGCNLAFNDVNMINNIVNVYCLLLRNRGVSNIYGTCYFKCNLTSSLPGTFLDVIAVNTGHYLNLYPTNNDAFKSTTNNYGTITAYNPFTAAIIRRGIIMSDYTAYDRALIEVSL